MTRPVNCSRPGILGTWGLATIPVAVTSVLASSTAPERSCTCHRSPGSSDGRHIRRCLDREAKRLSVAVQVVDKDAARRKERSAGRKRQAWKGRQVPARVEHQAVVEVRPRVPGLVAAFEHPVADAGTRQLARRRQPGGSGADDDRVESGGHDRRSVSRARAAGRYGAGVEQARHARLCARPHPGRETLAARRAARRNRAAQAGGQPLAALAIRQVPLNHPAACRRQLAIEISKELGELRPAVTFGCARAGGLLLLVDFIASCLLRGPVMPSRTHRVLPAVGLRYPRAHAGGPVVPCAAAP